MFLSAVYHRFFFILDPRGRLERKVGSACEELEDNEKGKGKGSGFIQRLIVVPHTRGA